MTCRKLTLSMFFVCAIFLQGTAQFPFLHVYLNTANCYAHSFGVTMLDSVDSHCAKAVIVSDKSAFRDGEALSALGLSNNSVAIRTLPGKLFYQELWRGAFSRFVFGIDGDTLYDTNLDFLFQYRDSINQHIAALGSNTLLRMTPHLDTSGDVIADHSTGGEVVLMDTYLNRLTFCKPLTGQGLIQNETLQLPDSSAGKTSSNLRPSNLFKRRLRFSSICDASSNDRSVSLFATLRRDSPDLGSADEIPLLVTFERSGICRSRRIIPRQGYTAANLTGSFVADTLYLPLYRQGAVVHEVHFGKFIEAADSLVEIASTREAEHFPAFIQDRLGGNYSDGFFSNGYYYFRCFPLVYDAIGMQYHDLSDHFKLTLENTISELSQGKFNNYYCVDALAVGKTCTLLYYKEQKLHFVKLDLDARRTVIDKVMSEPPGSTLTKMLIDQDHALFISSDHMHSWVVQLK